MASARETHDTSPLEPEQLSDDELVTIFEIERRLEEAESAAMENKLKGAAVYLKKAETRHPRVLLLDGGRGTGKTSLLLTLVKRWHSIALDDHVAVKELADKYEVRIETIDGDDKESIKTQVARSGKPIPDNVRVLAMLDFDPLPPGMPLIAAIVQAWRPLAEEYDRLLRSEDEDYEDEGSLMDHWYRLFQMAAAGWGTVSTSKNLIEQVLDRQEQVEHWQQIGEDWSLFVSKVIKASWRLKGEYELGERPVFVIMIDDCDLQVERISQLLPALRMLYHSSVFFLVAADRRHMAEMLQLDFYGKQSRLAQHSNAKSVSLWELVDDDRWASELADSSINKVFPLKNRWKLRRLALHELLDFPRHKSPSLKDILDGWPQKNDRERKWGSLGEYLKLMAGQPEAPVELPPIMAYRTAHQIVEQALRQKEPEERALEAIRHLLGRDDSDDLVRISKGREQSGRNGKRDRIVEYLGAGELTAFFHAGYRVETGEDSGVVLSARPDFAFRTPSSRMLLSTAGSARREEKITSAVIAASLSDDGYGVVATALNWDIGLALAWTEERVFEDELSLSLAFQWPVHVHPSPLQLLMWSRDWRDFIRKLQGDSTLRLERIAYAWIYYQLKWLRSDLDKLPSGFMDVPPPFDDEDKERFNEDSSWKSLLALEPESGTEQKYWIRRMQRLAMPEIGIPITVQKHLLEQVDPHDVDWLWDQRRRLITDAIVAAADRVGASAEGAEDQKQANRVAEIFEQRHQRTHGSPSEWSKHVEQPWAAAREVNLAPR